MNMPRSSPTRPLTNGKRTGKPHAKKRSHSEDQLQTISADGDLVLVCSPSKDQENSKQTSYSVRVSSAALRRPGSYFAILLDLEKFQEGRTLQETKLVLEAKYGSWDEAVRLAGVDELAHINVEIPPVATKLDRTALVETFFRIVTASDGRNASVSSGDSLHKLADMPIPFLASLAVLSDRFGVVPVLKDALRQAHTPKKEAPGDGLARLLRRLRTYDSGNEGRLRQAIYVSLILDDKEAVRSTTHILITRGSREWRFDTLDQCTAGIERAIWWYLPMGIEGRFFTVVQRFSIAHCNGMLTIFNRRTRIPPSVHPQHHRQPPKSLSPRLRSHSANGPPHPPTTAPMHTRLRKLASM